MKGFIIFISLAFILMVGGVAYRLMGHEEGMLVALMSTPVALIARHFGKTEKE
jgi:hypothetical protein